MAVAHPIRIDRVVLLAALAAFSARGAWADDCNHNGIPDDQELQGLLSFLLPSSLPAEHQPSGIVSADFDGDHHADLAVVNSAAASISFYHGNGDGTFAAPLDFPAAADGTAEIVAADLDGDGDLDLAVLHHDGEILSVFLNDGAGHFTRVSDLVTGSVPYSLAVGDITGDGLPELAIANVYDKNVTLYRNLGAGAFTLLSRIPVPSYPEAVTIADMDLDGKQDLLVGTYYGFAINFYRGTGGGQFALPVPTSVGLIPFAFATADFDGDGRPELALAAASPVDEHGYLLVLRLQSNGKFLETAWVEFGDVEAPVIADLDHDGKLDIAFPIFSEKAVGTFLNQGNGSFSIGPAIGINGCSSAIAVGDFNEDQQIDIASADGEAGTITLLQNKGGGDFDGRRVLGLYFVTTGALIVDLNNDGGNELVVSSIGGELGIYRYAPPGNWTRIDDILTTLSPYSTIAADIDKDGWADLIFSGYGFDGINVLRNDGTGHFPTTAEYPAGTSPDQLASADLDGDGFPDVVAVNRTSNTVTLLRNSGDGTFLPWITLATGSQPIDVALADVDQDGGVDLVVASTSPPTLSLFRNLQNGTFGQREDFALLASPLRLGLMDVDRDGNLDAILLNASSGGLQILINDGQGHWLSGAVIETAPGAEDFTVGDLDGDGLPDLVVTNYFNYERPSALISVIRNRGDGSFEAHRDFAAGEFPYDVAIGDLTGDGIPEIAWADEEWGFASVLIGNGRLAAPDCNHNGVPDDCDIASGGSRDENHNGMPDECECLGDLNGNHVVELADLATLLGAYGTNADGDLNGDGVTNLQDLAILLPRFGAVCP